MSQDLVQYFLSGMLNYEAYSDPSFSADALVINTECDY